MKLPDITPRLREALLEGGGGTGTATEARFLRERLALFCKVAFLVAAATLAGRCLLQLLFSDAPYLEWLASPAQGIHLALCVAMAAGWRYCAHQSSRRALRLVDAAVTLFFCTAVAVAHHFTFKEGGLVLDRALLFATIVLIGRALVIPSTAPRTFALSFAAMVPVVMGSALIFGAVPGTSVAFQTGLTALWAFATVAISAVASSVIYSLRRRARRAEQLGQYTLEKKLGEGAMGSVYKARHALLRRPTAIKVLRPDASDRASVARFEREVQLTSALTHPHTIAIFDYGFTPDGVFYYAMEYLPGITLQRLVEAEGPLPEGRTIHILKQVAASLAEAHALGLIHRDVKPANVILGERGGIHDFVKVLDFGLVKDTGGREDALVSGPNILLGTPYYISPEAIRSPGAIDARSDLYSLGAVGYFLLAGATLFECDTFLEACGHHLHTEVTPPSARLGRRLAPDLESVIMRCLEKDPDRRPPDAPALLRELEACADSSAWSHEDARRWWLEHPMPAVDAAGEVDSTITIDLEERVPER